MKTLFFTLALITAAFSPSLSFAEDAKKEPSAEKATEDEKNNPKSPRNRANEIFGMKMKGEDSGKNKLINAADGLFKTKKGDEESKKAAEKKEEAKK